MSCIGDKPSALYPQFTVTQLMDAARLEQQTSRRCRCCAHWDQRFPQNAGLGVCLRITASAFPAQPDDVPSICLGAHGQPMNSPMALDPFRAPENLEVRTREEFGCVQWMANPKKEPT
jgi:hypothetical protein